MMKKRIDFFVPAVRNVPILLLCLFSALLSAPSGAAGMDLDDPFSEILEDSPIPENELQHLEPHFGPAPRDAVLLEAEQLSFDPASWKIIERTLAFNRFNGAASEGKMLSGSPEGKGKAEGVFQVPEGKKLHLWVRYVDDNQKNSASATAFTVRVFSSGRQVAEKVFAAKHIPRLHDRYFRHDFQWDSMVFDAPAGELRVSIEKTAADASLGKQQEKQGKASSQNENQNENPFAGSIDCLLLTGDRAYHPHIFDFHPVFVRGTVLKEEKTPLRLQAAGIALPGKALPGRKNPELLKPGESSEWFYLSEHLKNNAKEKRFAAGIPVNPYARGDESEHFFKIEFSTTENESGIFAEILHAEPGLQCPFTLDPASRHLETDKDWSEVSLKNSRLHPTPAGKRPVLFPFGGTLALYEEIWSSQAIDNELQAQANLGLNDANSTILKSPKGRDAGFGNTFSDAEFLFHLTKGCICTPDTETMEKTMEKKISALREAGILEKCRSIGVMDEPAFGVSHVLDCVKETGKCREGFRNYLKSMKLPAEELGLNSLDEAEPTRDPANGALFYWSVRYRNHLMTEFLRTCTEIVTRFAPGLKTRVNFATELVSNGNMVQFGADWFEIFNSGALTSGETEDWSNLLPTYQVAGYITDVMRGACRKSAAPFEMLNIITGRSSWEIQAKGFSEIGRGARGMGFFRYGPSYSGASDSVSHVPEIHEGIKNITFPTGEVEEDLMKGTVAKGDAALLLSVTGDIRQILNFANPYGRERMWLHLLLSHMGVRLDVIEEQDLRDGLEAYTHLFVTDADIRKEFLTPLLKWIENGGTLIMTAGALTNDEYGRNLGFDEKTGLRRREAQIETKKIKDPSNHFGTLSGEDFSLSLPNGLQQVESGTVFLSDSQDRALASVHPFGKGKIVFCGLMPGFAYIRTQSARKDSFHSDRIYPPDGRNLMKRILREAGLTPSVKTDHFLVEAILTESPRADIVTLSNWSGTPREITLTLPDRQYRKIRCVPGKLLDSTSAEGLLRIRLETGAGGYVILEK